MSNTSIKTTKAFGIIEVLIASMIIVLVVFSLTAIASTSLSATNRSHDRIQAINLAQEGMEMVRQIRDTAWIDADPATGWGTWVADGNGVWSQVVPGQQYGIWRISIPATATKPAWPNRFFLNPNTFDTVDMNGTTFTRLVFIDNVGSLLPNVQNLSQADALQNQAYKVTVKVMIGDTSQSVSTSEILTNWRPNF